MLSDEGSSYECIDADCVQKPWMDLLLNWVNKCTGPPRAVSQLSLGALAAAANHYLPELSPGRAPLGPDDLELFLASHFNILRLRCLRAAREAGRRLQAAGAALAFLCVARGGARAAADVCARLPPPHQLALLVFCERLADMEVTVNNVELAIREACEAMENCDELEGSMITPLLSEDNTIRTVSEVSSQSDRDTAGALRSLRSSVMALPLAARAGPGSSSGLWRPRGGPVVPGAPSSPTTSFSTVLTREESGDTIIPRKRSSSIKASDADSDAKMGQIFAEEKHVQVSNERLLAGADNNTTALSALSETGASRGPHLETGASRGPHLEAGAADRGPSGDVNAVRRTASFNPFKISNPFPTRGLYIFHAGGFQSGPGYEGYKSKRMKEKKYYTTEDRSETVLWDCDCLFYVLRCRVMVFSCCLVLIVILLVLSLIFYFFYIEKPELKNNNTTATAKMLLVDGRRSGSLLTFGGKPKWMWECHNNTCEKVRATEYKPNMYPSYGRCTLLCAGPQLWPRPARAPQLGRALVALAAGRVRCAVRAAPSDRVREHLERAFGFFLKDIEALEKLGAKPAANHTLDLPLKTMHVLARVERDADPRLRLATDEAYVLRLGTDGPRLMVHASGDSFCGVRHALETLAQMIVLDESTGRLIGLSAALVRDAPRYPYRGLMLDTARNYIPVPDIVRTIDAMAASKLNTFHWRISDARSFPLLLPRLTEAFESSAYGRDMAYTREHVARVAAHAAARGVRVLLEAAPPPPGPAGAPPGAPPVGCEPPCRDRPCPTHTMDRTFFENLQYLYTEILGMTSVDDVFHLSPPPPPPTDCPALSADSEGWLTSALETLRLANQGALPALPIVWLPAGGAGGTGGGWARLGAQVADWREGLTEHQLARYRVIQSTKWDLSCEMRNHRCYRYRTWQEMYEWHSWKAIDALKIEGGEAILWTDLVDSGNLDPHLWPRAAAVAERLWSDEALPAALAPADHIRLDHHVSRLSLRGVAATPLWPRWCRAHPRACLPRQ